MFDLLRKVIQGQQFLGQFWSTEISNSVLGWGEHGEIDTLILSDSSLMPFNPIRYQPNSVQAHSTFRRSWTNFRPKSSQTQSESRWQCAGTIMEAEVLGWNQKRTRVPVSPCCLQHSTETFLCLTLPGVKGRPKKSSTLDDLPKWV